MIWQRDRELPLVVVDQNDAPIADVLGSITDLNLICAAPDLLRLLTWAVDTLRARSPDVLGMHPEGSEAAALIAKLTGEQ